MQTPGRSSVMEKRIAGRAHGFEGVRIVAVAVGLALIEAVVTMTSRELDPGLLALIRVTARTSVVWFALAFAATPLVALWPSPATKWLLRNRRYLGLAMAVSHGVHLVAIVILAARIGPAFWSAIAPTTLVGGGLGYAVLAAMVATSTDRAKVRLGRRRWHVLHLTGMWLFWLIFASTYAGQLDRDVFPGLATATMLGLALLRIAAGVRRRTRGRARA